MQVLVLVLVSVQAWEFSKMVEKSNLDLTIPFEETKRVLADQLDSIATLKDTLKTIFNATSVIVAIGGSLQALRSGDIVSSEIYFGIMAATLALFAIVIGICLWGMMPKRFDNPIMMNWETISSAFFGKDDRTVLEKMISQFLVAIDKNKAVIDGMVWKVKAAGVGFTLVVIGMIVLISVK